MFKYTLCFVKQNNNLLLLNRDFAPTKGLWNGVGGKIEESETPLECAIRETFEETGIELLNIRYKGIITWDVDGSYSGGMYAFLAELPNEYVYVTPSKVDEGILDWKPVDWILSEGNFGVGEMIPQFLPAILNNEGCYEHKCTLYNNKLISYTAIPITHEVVLN